MMDIHEKKALIALAENIISYSHEQPGLQELARISLAALTAEPVKVPDVAIPCPSNDKEEIAHNAGWNACRAELLRLNTIDNTAQQYEALAGWKMVPIGPSKEMLSQIHPIADGNCSHCGNQTTLDCEENMLLSWRDMLEAAPKPEDKC